jgi:hypothetical protein
MYNFHGTEIEWPRVREISGDAVIQDFSNGRFVGPEIFRIKKEDLTPGYGLGADPVVRAKIREITGEPAPLEHLR